MHYLLDNRIDPDDLETLHEVLVEAFPSFGTLGQPLLNLQIVSLASLHVLR